MTLFVVASTGLLARSTRSSPRPDSDFSKGAPAWRSWRQGARSSCAERVRLFDVVSQFLIAVAARQTLVLILDDLHWADRGALDLLRHVARVVPQRRLLIVGAYRDVEVEVTHPLADLLGAPQVEWET